jgi:hypothetical protein
MNQYVVDAGCCIDWNHFNSYKNYRVYNNVSACGQLANATATWWWLNHLLTSGNRHTYFRPSIANNLITFILVSWDGVRLSPLSTSATNRSIVPAPDDRWWVWSSRWNENWRGKPKYLEKNCLSSTLPTTNRTWLDLGSNPGPHVGKPECGAPQPNDLILQPKIWTHVNEKLSGRRLLRHLCHVYKKFSHRNLYWVVVGSTPDLKLSMLFWEIFLALDINGPDEIGAGIKVFITNSGKCFFGRTFTESSGPITFTLSFLSLFSQLVCVYKARRSEVFCAGLQNHESFSPPLLL